MQSVWSIFLLLFPVKLSVRASSSEVLLLRWDNGEQNPHSVSVIRACWFRGYLDLNANDQQEGPSNSTITTSQPASAKEKLGCF